MTGGQDGGTWVKVNETTDTGGWFADSDCAQQNPVGGRTELSVLAGGVSFIRNTGPTDAKYRWFSVREIQAP